MRTLLAGRRAKDTELDGARAGVGADHAQAAQRAPHSAGEVPPQAKSHASASAMRLPAGEPPPEKLEK